MYWPEHFGASALFGEKSKSGAGQVFDAKQKSRYDHINVAAAVSVFHISVKCISHAAFLRDNGM
jgi:hypothetical protein